MKKFLIKIIAFSFILFSISGCGQTTNDSSADSEVAVKEANAEQDKEANKKNDASNSSINEDTKKNSDESSNDNSKESDTKSGEKKEQSDADSSSQAVNTDASTNVNADNSANTDASSNANEVDNSAVDSQAAQTSNTQEEPAPQASTEPYFDSGYAQQVLALVNQQREAYGLSDLSWNDAAASAANVRATEIVGTFSHTRPDGSSCMTAYSGDYSCIGENIAAGQTNPSLVMTSWMNSEGHKENILNPSFTSLGVACYVVPGSAYTYYWVQTFIG